MHTDNFVVVVINDQSYFAAICALELVGGVIHPHMPLHSSRTAQHHRCTLATLQTFSCKLRSHKRESYLVFLWNLLSGLPFLPCWLPNLILFRLRLIACKRKYKTFEKSE